MKLATTIFGLLCLTSTVPASQVTVRCSAERAWGDQPMDIQIDIALPSEAGRYLMVSDQDGNKFTFLESAVGVGEIEISEVLGKAKESHRHKFIVTRMPDGNNSLVGFVTINSYVNSIRAELWKKEKSFIYFDTFNNEVIRGHCD